MHSKTKTDFKNDLDINIEFYKINYLESIIEREEEKIRIIKTRLFEVMDAMENLELKFSEKYYKYKSLGNSSGGPSSSTFKSTKDLIDNGDLFFSPPSFLNDPFECNFDIGYKVFSIVQSLYGIIKSKRGNTTKKLIDIYKEVFDNLLISADITNEDLFKQVAKLIIEKYNIEKEVIEGIYDPSNFIIDTKLVRILSLTSKNNDILMWSYYGDSHSGVCAELDINNILSVLIEKRSDYIYAFYGKVFYSIDRPNFDALVTSMPFLDRDILENMYMIKVLFTKFKDWKHEDETRFAVVLNNNKYKSEYDKFVTKCNVNYNYYGVNTKDSTIKLISHPSYTKLKKDSKDYLLK